MNARIDALVGSFEAELKAGLASEEALHRATQAWQALPQHSERDRYDNQLALARIIVAAVPHVTRTEAASLRSDLTTLVGAIRRRYEAADSPYLRSRAIVEVLARALAAGQCIREQTTEAHAALAGLPFVSEDELEQATAILAVDALSAVYEWRVCDASEGELADACDGELRALQSALAAHGFEPERVRQLAAAIAQRRELSARERTASLVRVFGLALEVAPDALPALDAVRDMILDMYRQIEPTQPLDLAARCREIHSAFELQLQAHGFDEAQLNDAFATLHELKPKTPGEFEIWRGAFVRILDPAIRVAPSELAATLIAMRETILQLGVEARGTLSAASLQAEGTAVLQRLEAELAAGEALSASVVRALGWFQTVPLRIPEDAAHARDAETALLQLMPGVMKIAAAYVAPGQEQVAEDLARSIDETLRRVQTLLQSSDVG